MKLQERDTDLGCFATWFCCVSRIIRTISQSVLLLIFLAIGKALLKWLRECRDACRRHGTSQAQPDVESGIGEHNGGAGTVFMVVDFNAWECAGSDILWAAVTTKIFERVRYGGACDLIA